MATAIDIWKWSLQLILIQLINYNEAHYLCQNLQLQSCNKRECSPTSFSLACPRSQDVSRQYLGITVKTDEAKLECTSSDVNYDWLHGINIGYVKFLNIQSCPLPNISFYKFLAHLNITGIKRIRINNGFGNLSLYGDYFQKIENITHLFMPNNQLSELPHQLFQNMTDLTNLDLHDNNLTLSNNYFSGLLNLKNLELGANNIQQLHSGTFQNLKNLEFLNLWGNKLTNLSKKMFVGLESITSLDVSGNQISQISADTFSAMKKLKNLNLVKNNFTSLPENIFSSTIELEMVKINYNERLNEIPHRLFANLSLLREINLSRCNLSTVPEDILWGTSQLIKMDLSGNSLATLPQLLFRDTQGLSDLDISNNKITSLHGYTFASLKNLRILHLDKNKMTSINEELFQGLKELDALHINNNYIEEVHINTFQTMTKLQHLVMSHNNLTFNNFIPKDSSPMAHCINLIALDLSYNNIKYMFSDWMWILHNLRILDLSYNNFTHLNAQDMQFFSPQIDVNLQYNKIATLDLLWLEVTNSPNATLESVTQMSVIKLTGNELDCNCRIYDLLRYQERLMHPIIYKRLTLIVDTLTCKAPPVLAGQPIAKLNSQTFTCEWESSRKCPNQCQCSKWLHAKHLVVNCTGAGLTQIPKEILNPQFPDKLLIDLILNDNSLNSLPLNTSLNQTNVTTLSASHNYISWIDDYALPSTLKELKLDHNNLTHLNSSFLEFLTNRTNVTLYNNPWSCDCESLDFLGFLQTSYKQVEKLYNVTCRDGSVIAQLVAEEICPLDRTVTIVASTAIAVIGIFIGLLAALYFRFQNEVKVWLYAHNMCLWFVTEEELDKDKIYDAFISYSHQDEDFVTRKLLPELENGTPPYKICIHYRDWIVGEFITTQITRSVDDSKRTIVVLSQNFIKSEWGRLEFRAAHKQALTEKRTRVIVVIYGDLGPLDNLDSELRSYLSTNTYVKWGDPWFWDKLRYALPHHRRTLLKSTHGADKLELINSSAVVKSSTPPADVAINPLEVINNVSNKKCKILNEVNGYENNGYTSPSCEIPMKSSA